MGEVDVGQLRKHLPEWLARARAGDEVVITERGRPVAMLTGIEEPMTAERLMHRSQRGPLLKVASFLGLVEEPARPARHASTGRWMQALLLGMLLAAALVAVDLTR